MLKNTFPKNISKSLMLAAYISSSVAILPSANATIVSIKTSISDQAIEVNLFDTTTPATVANFLTYVNDGAYTNSIIHRAPADFVIQGGGFTFNGNWPLEALATNATVINEPVYSNVAGTIAMAKQGNDANSATNQWFFNLTDNSDNLDRQNGGFTAFGQVTNGIEVLQQINTAKRCDYNPFTDIPMLFSDEQSCSDMITAGIENFIVIEQVTIIDSSEATDSNLNPALTEFPDSDGDSVMDVDDAFPNDPTRYRAEAAEKSSGGSMTWLVLVSLPLMAIRRRFFNT
jgi:peptidyl-prolyl cis-trans isomerase A (cyclophilin A)